MLDSPRLFQLLVGLLLLVRAVHVSAQLPYDPTRIIPAPKNSDLVYIFRPAPGAANSAQLLSLDVTSKLSSNNLQFNVLDATLPFSTSDSAAYTVVSEENGDLRVYSGNCADGADSAKIWKFSVDDNSKEGNGTWIEEEVASQNGKAGSSMAPMFLSTGISFSSNVGGQDPSLYFFGGMCPSENATQDDWQSAASYSNYVVQAEANNSTNLTLSVDETQGPPVAEAGFALVPLPPTYSNTSDGSQDQQQNFVLVGGHTKSAFINMSQIALYSLPQKSWTYLGVEQPGDGHTDLVKRDSTTVEPRSGHTAVLSEDGTKIIVFGGWVGDVNTPAEPQLAVLHVGEGYGGNGAWSWSTPSTSGSGIASGSGIYGHGATLLSGNVLMVAGGFSITTSSARFMPRSALKENSQSYFFNISSNTWIAEYDASQAASSNSTSGANTASGTSKVGLGAGLGIGLAAVLAMTVFYFWYKRHLKKHRQLREKEIATMSRAAHRYHGLHSYDDEFQNDYMNDDAAALAPDPWFNGRQGWKGRAPFEAERTGLLVEIPSPTRGLRRNMGGRQHQPPPPPRLDEGYNRGSGHIPPIDELEEDDVEANGRTGMPEMSERTVQKRLSLSNPPVLDPFSDPEPLRSHPVYFPPTAGSPGKKPVVEAGPSTLPASHVAEFRTGSPNWEVIGGPNSQSTTSRSGQPSPEKSDRTESNLSDQSGKSGRSKMSSSTSAGSVVRTLSNASAALIASFTNPFSHDRQQLSLQIPPPIPPTIPRESGDSIAGSGRADADSFTTARSSLGGPQSEGDALLGGRSDEVPTTPMLPRQQTPSPDQDLTEQLQQTPTSFYNPPTFAQNQTPPLPKRRQELVSESSSSISPGKIPHYPSSDTLELHTPIDNSFATKDRSKSWIGSVRLALARVPSSRDRSQSLTSGYHRRRRYLYDEGGKLVSSDGAIIPKRNRSRSRSPKRRRHLQKRAVSGFDESNRASTAGPSIASPSATDPPRRAASDASFWRSKGRKAWAEDTSSPLFSTPRGNQVLDERDWAVATPDPEAARETLFTGPDGAILRPAEGDDSEWDIEAASENRLVQMLFTVPRQRLRVVNADIGDGSTTISRSRGASGETSLRSLRIASGEASNGSGQRISSHASGKSGSLRRVSSADPDLGSSGLRSRVLSSSTLKSADVGPLTGATGSSGADDGRYKVGGGSGAPFSSDKALPAPPSPELVKQKRKEKGKGRAVSGSASPAASSSSPSNHSLGDSVNASRESLAAAGGGLPLRMGVPVGSAVGGYLSGGDSSAAAIQLSSQTRTRNISNQQNFNLLPSPAFGQPFHLPPPRGTPSASPSPTSPSHPSHSHSQAQTSTQAPSQTQISFGDNLSPSPPSSDLPSLAPSPGRLTPDSPRAPPPLSVSTTSLPLSFRTARSSRLHVTESVEDSDPSTPEDDYSGWAALTPSSTGGDVANASPLHGPRIPARSPLRDSRGSPVRGGGPGGSPLKEHWTLPSPGPLTPSPLTPRSPRSNTGGRESADEGSSSPTRPSRAARTGRPTQARSPVRGNPLRERFEGLARSGLDVGRGSLSPSPITSITGTAGTGTTNTGAAATTSSETATEPSSTLLSSPLPTSPKQLTLKEAKAAAARISPSPSSPFFTPLEPPPRLDFLSPGADASKPRSRSPSPSKAGERGRLRERLEGGSRGVSNAGSKSPAGSAKSGRSVNSVKDRIAQFEKRVGA